ncbi:MAG: chromosome segregation protein ParM [Bradyrhizobium sp.]|nr:chromosome segregation protein ParM [Bradyrhizobium sp.]
MSAHDPSGRDLPLIEWGEALRREAVEAARLRRWVLFWLFAFWAIVIQMVFPPAPRLVWNASASAPIGLYAVRPGARIVAGDMVIAWLPQPYRRLAATRHYLPENVPLVKRVIGAPHDRICAIGAVISANGRRVATRLATDGQGRSMLWWRGCRTLGRGEYFLLMEGVAASFDGRYFGITRASDVVGKAYPLWTR